MYYKLQENNALYKFFEYTFFGFLILLATSWPFGYFIQNLSIGLPVLELSIFCLSVLSLARVDIYLIYRRNLILPFLWLVIGLIFYLTIGYYKHGIYALRDGAFFTSAVIFFPAFIFAYSSRKLNFVILFKILFYSSLWLEVLDRTLLANLFGDLTFLTFGQAEAPIFGGTMGSGVVIFGTLLLALTSLKVKISLLDLVFLFLAMELLILHQTRTYYLSLFVIIISLNILDSKFLKSTFLFSVCFLLLFTVNSYVFELLRSVWGLAFETYVETSRVLKFSDVDPSINMMTSLLSQGLTDYSPENSITQNLNKETLEFSGSAGGLHQRLAWWNYLVSRGLMDVHSAIFGLGYGADLNFWVNRVREPHNVLVSVFARGGLLILILWLFFLCWMACNIWIYYKSKLSTNDEIMLITSIGVQLSTLATSLFQPSFTSTPVCISFYLFSGIIFGFIFRDKRQALIASSNHLY